MARELFHLPDLPNAGYATEREKTLSDAIMEFMRQTERNRVRLLTIVIDGKARWREVAQSVWGGLRIGEDLDLLDSIYDYFVLQAAQAYPLTQRALLDNLQNPSVRRDLLRELLPKLEVEREQLVLLDKWAP
jgi:hypothetical protein